MYQEKLDALNDSNSFLDQAERAIEIGNLYREMFPNRSELSVMYPDNLSVVKRAAVSICRIKSYGQGQSLEAINDTFYGLEEPSPALVVEASSEGHTAFDILSRIVVAEAALRETGELRSKVIIVSAEDPDERLSPVQTQNPNIFDLLGGHKYVKLDGTRIDFREPINDAIVNLMQDEAAKRNM
jgi:hypothetical protein